jgi:hypothetical protein
MRALWANALGAAIFIGTVVGAVGDELDSGTPVGVVDKHPVAPLSETWRGALENVPIFDSAPNVEARSLLENVAGDIRGNANRFTPLTSVGGEKHSKRDVIFAVAVGEIWREITLPDGEVDGNGHVSGRSVTGIVPSQFDDQSRELERTRARADNPVFPIEIVQPNESALSGNKRVAASAPKPVGRELQRESEKGNSDGRDGRPNFWLGIINRVINDGGPRDYNAFTFGAVFLIGTTLILILGTLQNVNASRKTWGKE